jgi:hypothetical protein
MTAHRFPPSGKIGIVAILAALLLGSHPLTAHAQDAAAGRELFEKRIRPILVRDCYKCHSPATKTPKGGLRLDTPSGLRRGGDTGPIVVPGKPADSLLIQALHHENRAMPPGQKLPAAVIADFVRWVEMGAPDPRPEPTDVRAAAALAWDALVEERRQWWSLQPVAAPPVPAVQDPRWAGQPIDRFLQAKREAVGVRPAPPADRTTLIRRLTFALIGLPPASEELERFVNDTAPDAWERLVDRLLASPHFGERWARHWMDVVRYTDTYGYEWDIPAKGAWRYRDYLVRAFNQDLPFDQSIREQIAGDLLRTPRTDPRSHLNESLAGVMFYQMGEKRHGDSADFDGIHQEMLDNKIDAFGKTFQATTIACARCHDHKLDPIAQREYYALAGAFMSSRWVTNTLDTPEANAPLIHQLGSVKAQLRTALANQWIDEVNHLPNLLFGKVPRSEAWQKLLTPPSKSEPMLEDCFSPWLQLSRPTTAPVADLWRKLARQYAEQRQTRTATNARDFALVADFGQEVPPGWSVDGVGLRQVVPCGDFTVALSGSAAVGRLLPGGLFTHALSPRLNGAVRTPLLNRFDRQQLSFEYCGGDFSAHRTVVDNAFLTERQKYLDKPTLGWLRLSAQPAMKNRRVYIELATKTSNPNFPPRVGLGGECSEEQADDPRSWFGLRRVFAHNVDREPADELARFGPLFAGDAPRDLPEAAARYAAWFRAALQAWAANHATPEDVALLNGLLDRGVLTNHCDLTGNPQVAALVNRYRDLEKQLTLPRTINGMADMDPGCNYRLNVRGEYDQLGEAVPRGYLRQLPGAGQPFADRHSGRAELAQRIASASNPLTARVFVNRVWHWLFGAGLVSTLDDFGHAGARPTHPELLDYLAGRFTADGWSPKRLIRTIVLTETWQQSSATTADALVVDPDNGLLHHYALQRLDAECIRDAMLTASGRLDPRLYGPPVNPHRPKEDPQKRLFSGPVDGDGRRSLYTKITIMEPPRFLATFNQPTPKIPTGRRDVTNTPAQSLALLNDPFVHGQAERWAAQLMDTPDPSVSVRLTRMFVRALGRQPTAEEVCRWNAAVADFAALHGVGCGHLLHSKAVWQDVAHALFNAKEFIYLR